MSIYNKTRLLPFQLHIIRPQYPHDHVPHAHISQHPKLRTSSFPCDVHFETATTEMHNHNYHSNNQLTIFDLKNVILIFTN